MAENRKFSRAADEQRRRERDAAVERARNEDRGFSELRGELIEIDGVPDHIRVIEAGAAWVDSAEDRAGQN